MGPDSPTVAKLEHRLQQLQAEHKKFVVKDEFSKIYSENGGVGYNAFTSKDQTSYLISLPANNCIFSRLNQGIDGRITRGIYGRQDRGDNRN